MRALQDSGEQLVALPAAELAKYLSTTSACVTPLKPRADHSWGWTQASITVCYWSLYRSRTHCQGLYFGPPRDRVRNFIVSNSGSTALKVTALIEILAASCRDVATEADQTAPERAKGNERTHSRKLFRYLTS